jgi:hypothetical protein
MVKVEEDREPEGYPWLHHLQRRRSILPIQEETEEMPQIRKFRPLKPVKEEVHRCAFIVDHSYEYE